MKNYFNKVITILTFLIIWTCILFLFSNSNNLHNLQVIFSQYSIDTFEEKIIYLENYHNEKHILYITITAIKVIILLRNLLGMI